MSNDFNLEASVEVKVTQAVKSVNELLNAIRGIAPAADTTDAALRKMGQGAGDGIRKATREASQLESAVRKAAKAGAVGGDPLPGLGGSNALLNRFTTEQNKAAQATQKTASEVDKLAAAVKKAVDAGGRGDVLPGLGGQNALINRFTKAQDEAARSATRRGKAEQDAAYASYASNIRATEQIEKTERNLNSQRYALYDVSRAWGAVSLAITGALGAMGAVTVDYEKNFARVQRTTEVTGQKATELREALVDLTTQMPQSFGDVTEIATLAGQLGIAEDAVASFTSTVARFSSTTGMTVDSAATQLGRLAELTNTPQTEFENLGSAILKTGINAVATESAILGIASQIATAGDLAGFTVEEIVGLSSALASLGVAPERARGAVQRIFGNITSSVSEGGKSLESFAATSDMTVTEFSEAWKNEPQVAFSAFIDGLKRVNESGGDTNAFLKTLGINAVRDIQTLELLANNTNVYNAALADSRSGYAGATQLSESYAITAETLAAKLQILAQTIMGIIANVGQASSGPLKDLVDIITAVAKGFYELSKNPVAQFFIAGAAGLALMVAGMAGLKAMTALISAQMLALQTAYTSSAFAANRKTGTLRALGAQLGALVIGTQRATAANQAYAASLDAGTGKARAFAAGTAAAASSTRALGGALKGALVGTGVGIALVAVGSAVEALMGAFESSESKAEKFFGTFDGLSSAMRKDTEAYKEAEAAVKGSGVAYRTLETDAKDATAAIDQSAAVLEGSALVAQQGLKGATEEATGAVREQISVLGEYSLASLANAIATNDGTKKLFEQHGPLLAEAGFVFDEYVRKIAEGGGAGEQYIRDLMTVQEDLGAGAMSLIATNRSLTAAEAEAANTAALSADKMVTALASLLGPARDSEAGIEAVAAKAAVLGDSALLGADGLGALDDEAEAAADTVDDFATSLMGAVNAEAAMEGALHKLGNSIRDNGNSFDTLSEQGRNNLNSLSSAISAMAEQAGGDNAMLFTNLYSMLGGLESAGADVQGELGFVYDQLAVLAQEQWGISLDTSQPIGSIYQFIDAAIEALRVRAELERSANPQTPFAPGYKNNSPFAPKPQDNAYDQQIKELERLRKSLGDADKGTKSFNKGLKEMGSNGSGAGSGLRDAAKAAKELKVEIRTVSDWVSDLSSLLARGMQLQFGVQNAKDKIKELWREFKEDLKSDPIDLDELIQRRHGKTEAKDAIAQTYIDMRKAAADAALAVADANRRIQQSLADLSGLRADKKVLEYQLSVAMRHGDELRASQIRAELAKNASDQADAQAELAKNQKDAADAAAAQDRSLKGNSQAAIKNRNTVRGLVSEYGDYIQALRDSGASDAEIRAAVAQSAQDFMDQGTAMGFSAEELAAYRETIARMAPSQSDNTKKLEGNSKAAVENRRKMQNLVDAYHDELKAMAESGASKEELQKKSKELAKKLEEEALKLGFAKDQVTPYKDAVADFGRVVSTVPKDVTVKLKTNADMSGIDRAVSEYNAKKKLVQFNAKVDASSANEWRRNNTGGRGLSKPINTSVKINVDSNMSAKKALQEQLRVANEQLSKAYKASPGGASSAISQWERRVSDIIRKLAKYDVGGFTGRGGRHEAAGIVHKGEFVLPQSMVNQSTGLPDLGAMLRGRVLDFQTPARSAAQNRTSDQPTVVELVPYQLQQLGRMVSTTLAVDGRVVASTQATQNRINQTRGVG